jgi:hypothetical protein
MTTADVLVVGARRRRLPYSAAWSMCPRSAFGCILTKSASTFPTTKSTSTAI